jgi:hypothetical protein
MQAVLSTTTAPAPDLEAVKARQQAAWSAGDYAEIGTRLQIVGESLCEAVDLRSGSRVLDVAAGNGNAAPVFPHHATAPALVIDQYWHASASGDKQCRSLHADVPIVIEHDQIVLRCGHLDHVLLRQEFISERRMHFQDTSEVALLAGKILPGDM